MDVELNNLHKEIARNREALRLATSERNDPLTFKLSHQGLRAELKDLNKQLADLEVDHTDLSDALTRKERFATT